MKDKVIHHERQILRELGFMVYVELPHKYLLNYSIHVLKCSQELAQHAWNFVNDRYGALFVPIINFCVVYEQMFL